MCVDAAVGVRSGDVAHAAVLGHSVIECNPDGAGRNRTDRPVLPVLVPGNGLARNRRLAEHLAAPEDDVLADELRYQVQDAWVTRILQPLRRGRFVMRLSV